MNNYAVILKSEEQILADSLWLYLNLRYHRPFINRKLSWSLKKKFFLKSLKKWYHITEHIKNAGLGGEEESGFLSQPTGIVLYTHSPVYTVGKSSKCKENDALEKDSSFLGTAPSNSTKQGESKEILCFIFIIRSVQTGIDSDNFQDSNENCLGSTYDSLIETWYPLCQKYNANLLSAFILNNVYWI